MLYPIGIQDFEAIRRDGYVYVDKTEQIFKLATTGKYYFLSRPRRFGKSLLVSTMEAYFCGRRDLFEGLAMAELEKEWIEYPVLRMDLSGKTYDSPEVLSKVLESTLSRWEAEYGCGNDSGVPGLRFGNIIESAHVQTGRPVVILIDEYDKPIVDNLGDEALTEVFCRQLQGFYGVLKSQDAHIRFGFLTGVTKMGKLSVFSALNNLADISMDTRYWDICGITEDELHNCFDASVSDLAVANGETQEGCYARLARMYDGYHFCEDAPGGTYNPFSLLNTFSSLKFREYWFETGTPSFLVRYLRQGNYLLDDVTANMVPESRLSGSSYERPDVITLMYQSGYLTISGYDKRFRLYKLDYPNDEVRNGFMNSLVQFYAPVAETRSAFSVYRFVQDIESGDAEGLMNRFTAFFADMDYQVQGDLELYFQNTMYVMLKLMGQQVSVERHTSNGRIDVVIEAPEYVYILELKRDTSADEALAQIREKGYDKPFLSSGKTIFTIGANFSSATRRLEEWKLG